LEGISNRKAIYRRGMMDFLVVGPGAMGCLFAAKLKIAGHDVTLLDYRPERAALISDNGIRVEGIAGEYKVRVPTMTQEVPRTPEVVLICVKANSTRQAAQGLRPCIGPETRILTLQNGLGNLDTLVELFGAHRVLGGVTAEAATLLGPGHIRHAGKGHTLIGPSAPQEDVLKQIVSAFADAGFEAQEVDQVEDVIWGKLIVNVGINALTALTRLKNGRLPELGGTRKVMENAVREAVAVAAAKHIRLPYADPLARVTEVCRATSGNIASMLQDVLHQRVTEVAFINGAIVREAQALGIPTPVNDTLTSLVEAVQETYSESVGIE
jgi:2-dehydropantoate 2-reductase